jgi:hypothetical protein
VQLGESALRTRRLVAERVCRQRQSAKPPIGSMPSG